MQTHRRADQPPVEDVLTEVQELRRMEDLLRGRNDVLQMLAQGAPTDVVLESLVLGAEHVAPGLRCAVLLLDRAQGTLHHGAAPSLPEFYNDAIDGLAIGPRVGSCGSAAFLGERIIVEDVMVHPNWEGYRDLARRAGIRASWSEPVRSSTGDVLGTFAMYYGTVRVPEKLELEVIQRSAQIAGVAIEHDQARAELRASEERFRQVTETIRDVFWLTDWEKQKVLYVSPAYQEIWGRSPQSLIDDPRSWTYDIVPEDREQAMAAFAKAGEGNFETEYRIRRKDGSVRWIFDRAFPIKDESGQVYRVAGVSEDVTERKLTEEALRAANRRLDEVTRHKLQSLTTELLLAEERERRRLAVDLHDGLNQTLVLARLKVAGLRNSADATTEEKLQEVEELIDSANRSARSLTFQLSPPVLHDLGFQPAVQWLVEDVQESYGIVIRLEEAAEELPLESRVKMLLFRAVRELLINVAKHAKANEAVVRIAHAAGSIRITVQDDGVAFDPANSSRRGLGLGSIEERLENLGGHMSIDTQKDRGTQITLVAPLDKGMEARTTTGETK